MRGTGLWFGGNHSRRSRVPALAVLSLLLALGQADCSSQSLGKPRNVVLIVIDTLRADHLTPYGYGRPTSPNIARLAENALVCNQAFSHAPWTMPSMATLFTSTYESVHQISMRPHGRTDYSVLDPDYVTLAEYLHERRYKTAAISSQVWIAPETGFDAGFDDFSIVSGTSDPQSSELVTMNAVRWLQARRPDPFLLYLHYMAPHTPYDPPPPFDRSPWVKPMPAKFAALNGMNQGQMWDFIRSLEPPGPNQATPEDIEYLSSLYDAEIATVDFWIGVLVRELERLGLLKSSLVVVVSDHGESFFEHGEFLHISHLYNENLRVPMIISNPELFPKARHVDSLVGLIDLFPTLVDMLGGEPLPQFEGESVLAPVPRPTVYAERLTFEDDGSVSTLAKIQSRDWSLIERGENGRLDLYRLGAAGWEEDGPVEGESTVRQSLIEALRRRHAANLTSPFKFKRKTTTLDERMVERLKSLGYIQSTGEPAHRP
jgi:arylsulfatase A-like enzyme